MLLLDCRCLCRAIICVNLVVSSAIMAQGQTRRALLIGIDHYAPPSGAVIPVAPAGHALDSRFAPGETWNDLRGPLIDIDGIRVLLRQNYGFQDIRVLEEQQATRQGILAAIDTLVGDTHPGDFDVIYYAGHGSRRRDTLSSKNQLDETIVPIDAWKGTYDIRDKELAVRFNQIVYDKHAHLTAIFDSCNSGTMARGITQTVVRALPWDDRDVADEKKRDPGAITEADLKRKPQDGDAIIVAAAASTENAVEAAYDDDNQWHGAFSRALQRVLQANTQSLSADDVVAEVSNMLHADPVQFQQPSVEGRIKQSLFGEPVAAHPLHVHASKVSDTDISLDMGSAAGFDLGTEFTSIGSAIGGRQETVIGVNRIDGPLASTARILSGRTTVQPGETFELTKMVYPQEARLVIFAATPQADPVAAAAQAKASYPGLSWIADPTDKPIDFLVVNSGAGWVAYSQTGTLTAPGPAVAGTAFLLQGPPASLRSAIEASAPFQHNAFTFTRKLSDANYFLAMRPGLKGGVEYAFFDPAILKPHSAGVWIHSPEDFEPDATLNGGTPPDVVCRNDVSLPVRTAWLSDVSRNGNALVDALNRRIVRLGKLRVWLQSPSLAPGIGAWPYRLAPVDPASGGPIVTPLHKGQTYQVRLTATAEDRAKFGVKARYVYLFGFDCAANPYLLYPQQDQNGDAAIPQPDAEGVYPLSQPVGDAMSVDTPFGADTLFLLVTEQKLTDPGILVQDGVSSGARGVTNRFDALIGEMSNANTRGPKVIPANWFIQQIVLPSRP